MPRTKWPSHANFAQREMRFFRPPLPRLEECWSRIKYNIWYTVLMLFTYFHHWDFLVKIYLGTQDFFLTTESHKEAPKELFSLSDNPRKIYRKIKSKSKKSQFWVEKKMCGQHTVCGRYYFCTPKSSCCQKGYVKKKLDI